MPNIHLRYTVPIHILFIAAFVSILDSKRLSLSTNYSKMHYLVFACIAVIFILLFKGNRFAYVDANFLCIYTLYKDAILTEFSNINTYLIYLIFIITNIFIVFFIFALDRFCVIKKRYTLPTFALATISAITLVVGSCQYRYWSTANISEVSELQKINQFITNDKDSDVLCLVNNGGWSCFTIEPYIDKTDKKFIIENASYFKDSMCCSSTGQISNIVANISFSPLHSNKNISLRKINYILLPRDTILNNYGFTFSNVELLSEFNGEYYQLFKNVNEESINIYVS